MRDVHGQGLLATAESAEIRHIPVQADQAKQALGEPSSPWSLGPVAFPWLDLPQHHAKKDLHRKAGLDGSVAVIGLSPSSTGRLRTPRHLWIEPALQRLRAIAYRPMDRQRAPTLERLVVRGPVQGLVGQCVRPAHQPQLARWILKMNPSQDLCNRAGCIVKAKQVLK